VKIIFTGTGTSQGVPLIGCSCDVCTSPDPKDNRLRSSVLIENKGVRMVIDTGPDFRQQMLRYRVNTLDAVIFTHSHKDHIAGLDDIRAYNYFQQKAMDVYATLDTQNALRREFAYIFENQNYPGIPKINLHTIHEEASFEVLGNEIVPIKVLHYQMEVLGFRIGDFTYITDANYIPETEIEKIKGSKYLVINALRKEKHISHYTLDEAIEVAQNIGASKTYFTHISHQLGLHEEVERELPENIFLSYDGLTLNL